MLTCCAYNHYVFRSQVGLLFLNAHWTKDGKPHPSSLNCILRTPNINLYDIKHRVRLNFGTGKADQPHARELEV